MKEINVVMVDGSMETFDFEAMMFHHVASEMILRYGIKPEDVKSFIHDLQVIKEYGESCNG